MASKNNARNGIDQPVLGYSYAMFGIAFWRHAMHDVWRLKCDVITKTTHHSTLQFHKGCTFITSAMHSLLCLIESSCCSMYEKPDSLHY